MKKITMIITFVLGIALLFGACDKMEDIHDKFLDDGDIIYAPKPLEAQTFAGKNRIKIKYYLVNAVNVNKCVIEWNDGADSQTQDISPNVPTDSIEFLINNLEEKSYLFKVYTIDKNGNRSVKEQVTGSVYDARYQAGLTNRPILSIEGGGTADSVLITWGSAPQGNTKVEYSYTNREGQLVTKTLTPDLDKAVIRGWESESTLTYKSYYIPEEAAIDTFATEEATEALPIFIDFQGEYLAKTNWSIVDFDSEEAGGEGPVNGYATAAIDGDDNTFWHTAWASSNPPHPHYLTIDLGSVVKMSAFELVKRKNKNDCQKNFKVEISLDGVTFTSLGTFIYEQANASQRYQTNSLPLLRYIKYTVTDGWTGANHTHLAEFNVEGQVAEKIDKSDWEAIDFSSQEAGGEGAVNGYVTAAFDDDINTFWHTAWSTSSPDYPHYITMDMKKTVRMFAMDFARRQGNSGGHSKFQIMTSMDGENFVDQGTFDFDRTSNAFQMYSLAFMPEARYFKFIALEGPNNYTSLAEMNVYGQVLE
ncbi:MAG: DUF4998 domain-containing protein [Draconibacterium sp.]